MDGKALWGGLKGYLGSLLVTILFPLLWLRAFRLARRHKDSDPRGALKVGAAVVVSLLIGVGGIIKLTEFQADATAGMYKSMGTRVATAIGETEYADRVATVGAADIAIPIIQRNLANATAAGDSAKEKELQDALDAAQSDRAKAEARATALAPNHALAMQVAPAITAQDDSRVRKLVAGANLADPPHAVADTEAAFALKDKAVHDMRSMMLLFVWPSLAGAFLAPFAFALGSILAHAFEPSDSVGYKQYPGGAAGLFLLLGAFGIPAVPFAAWVFRDMQMRSVEGQIAL